MSTESHQDDRPRAVAYTCFHFDDLPQARREVEEAIQRYTENLSDRPLLVGIFSDEIPEGQRFHHQPLFRRDNGKELFRRLGFGAHLVLKSFRHLAGVGDLQKLLAVARQQQATLHVLDLGVDGSPETIEMLRMTVAIMTSMTRARDVYLAPKKTQPKRGSSKSRSTRPPAPTAKQSSARRK